MNYVQQLDSYLKLVNCELKADADSNGEVYMKYNATVISNILKKDIYHSVKDVISMKEYGLIKIENQRLYILYNCY